MEKKQGFFSALKDEVVRGLSPSRSRSRSCSPASTVSPMSGLLRRKKGHGSSNNRLSLQPEQPIARSGSMRPVVGETLTPLMEGPDPDGGESKRGGSGIGSWMKGQLSRTPSVANAACRRSDLRLLLGVMGAPWAPVHVSTLDPLPHLSIKDTPIETSCARRHLVGRSFKTPFGMLMRCAYKGLEEQPRRCKQRPRCGGSQYRRRRRSNFLTEKIGGSDQGLAKSIRDAIVPF